MEHPTTSKGLTNNIDITSKSTVRQHLQHEQHDNATEQNVPSPLQVQVSKEGQQYYNPAPMQYQQATSNTSAPSSSTIDDFEENLFNSLLYSVDESTEKEILKNLNITDELLTTFNLEADNSSSFDNLNLNDFQPITIDDQSFDEKIFERIQRQESFEFKPEYKETRDKLEKELSLFREINLHEPQQQLGSEEINTESEIMQISSNNPKYIKHAKLDDHLLYK